MTLHIIARKQQRSPGRGPSTAATSPSTSSSNHTSTPFVNPIVQLPPAPISTLTQNTTRDALLTIANGPSGDILPASLQLTASDPTPTVTSISDVTRPLSSNVMVPIASTPLPTAVTAPHGVSDQPPAAMLGVHAIQAQVEALINSASDSVVGSSDSSQAPLLASIPSVPSVPALATLSAASLSATRSSSPGLMADAAASTGPSFQNTFAQYQAPQNHDRALKDTARSAESQSQDASTLPAGGVGAAPLKQEAEALTLTRQAEERAADALIADIHAQEDVQESSLQVKIKHSNTGTDLAAAAKAIGLEADADLLDGMSQDQRALAVAIRRLGAEHGEAAQKAIQQAAAAAAAAAAARASQELARAAAKEQATTSNSRAGSQSVAGSSTPASAASPATSKGSSGPVKRFPCPKCDKAFARAYNLNTHLSTHDPDPNRSKPFPCPYPSCKSEGGRSFSRKHDLQRHVASIHEKEAEPGILGDPEEVVNGDTGGLVSLGLGTPGKKFRCDNCGRSFVRRDACNRHQCDGNDSPTSRPSQSPSSTLHASSLSPRFGTPQRVTGGTPVALPRVRPKGAAHSQVSTAGTVSRRSASPGAAGTRRPSGSRASSSLSKEVQAVAKQLQARVEAQSPGPQGSAPSSRPLAPLPGGERRNFPLSAISLYASTSTSSMHPSSSSSATSSKVQIGK